MSLPPIKTTHDFLQALTPAQVLEYDGLEHGIDRIDPFFYHTWKDSYDNLYPRWQIGQSADSFFLDTLVQADSNRGGRIIKVLNRGAKLLNEKGLSSESQRILDLRGVLQERTKSLISANKVWESRKWDLCYSGTTAPNEINIYGRSRFLPLRAFEGLPLSIKSVIIHDDEFSLAPD